MKLKMLIKFKTNNCFKMKEYVAKAMCGKEANLESFCIEWNEILL